MYIYIIIFVLIEFGGVITSVGILYKRKSFDSISKSVYDSRVANT